MYEFLEPQQIPDPSFGEPLLGDAEGSVIQLQCFQTSNTYMSLQLNRIYNIHFNVLDLL